MAEIDQNRRIDDLLGEAQEGFRRGLSVVGDWGNQARDIVQKKPGVMIGAVAVVGLLAGFLIGRRFSNN